MLEKIEIKRELRTIKAANPDLINKRIFIEFPGSPKITEIVRLKLRANGYSIVDNKAESEAAFTLRSNFGLSGAGKEEVRGKTESLIEGPSEEGASRPDYKHQTVDLLQVGVSAARTGITSVFSITDIGMWLSQKTGIAGRFNEALTGDPRGFCYGENCNKRTNSVIMMATGGVDGAWYVVEKAFSEQIVLHVVIEDSIETVLKPFYELKEKQKSVAGENQ